ncbi:hypothetical protein AAG570_009013, partial [Ranatra chinensis]
FTGTFIEKWADYWKGVLSDYAQVGRDVATDAVNNPAKAAAIVATISFLGYCAHTNPDDNHFRDRLLEHVNSFAMIAQPVRNSNSVSYIMQLATAYNAGQVRLFSAGFFTVVWLADYNSSMGQYKANCNYLSPSVFDFHKRIVDIGFLNRWWLIDYKMLDYDVSLEEWNKT